MNPYDFITALLDKIHPGGKTDFLHPVTLTVTSGDHVFQVNADKSIDGEWRLYCQPVEFHANQKEAQNER